MRANHPGVCPHCKTGVRFETPKVHIMGAQHVTDSFRVITPGGFSFEEQVAACPVCGKAVVSMPLVFEGGSQFGGPGIVWPVGAMRPLPREVHAAAPTLVADFAEAVAVLPHSRKASAALARRCLQFILVSAGGAKKKDLADQIDEVLPKLPVDLAHNVDAIRHVGNFAAHPMKSTSTGTIVDVDDGEAEWLLDVLEQLMDFYYVAPAKAKAKRDALNAKLADLKKPPLKTP